MVNRRKVLWRGRVAVERRWGVVKLLIVIGNWGDFHIYYGVIAADR